MQRAAVGAHLTLIVVSARVTFSEVKTKVKFYFQTSIGTLKDVTCKTCTTKSNLNTFFIFCSVDSGKIVVMCELDWMTDELD